VRTAIHPSCRLLQRVVLLGCACDLACLRLLTSVSSVVVRSRSAASSGTGRTRS
jgi:hypothetical protein